MRSKELTLEHFHSLDQKGLPLPPISNHSGRLPWPRVSCPHNLSPSSQLLSGRVA